MATAVGAAGGACFWLLNLPLPWMLGAIMSSTIVALGGAKLEVHGPTRTALLTVIGVLLGSTFDASLLARVVDWTAAIVILCLYVPATTLLVSFYLRRVMRLDRVSAFFAGAPGGLSEMSMMGEAMGGDIRTIAMLHSMRILLTVFTLSFGYQFILGYELPATPVTGKPAGGMADYAILLACAAGGAAMGRLLHLPAPFLFGPMVVSAAVHVAGFTAAAPPALLVIVAQVVFGASIGARFNGAPVRMLVRLSGAAVVSTALMLLSTLAFAAVMIWLTSVPVPAAILALAPGGLTEMSLIALALGVDTAFVATMHVARIFMVVAVAPLLWRALR